MTGWIHQAAGPDSHHGWGGMMKKAAALSALWLGMALAACAASHIVLTVDVLSFLRADSLDAFSFGVRAGVPQTDFTVSRPFSLPSRFGPGNVDSVAVTAGAILESTRGGGTVALDVFFANDEASLFTGQPYVSAHATVSGVATDPGPDFDGRLALTVLQLRVVMHDQGF